MSTNATGAEVEAAQTTTEQQEQAPVIPGRDEVLNHFAREILGTPETAAPPATEAEAEDATGESALSQEEEQQPAEQVENHLDEDLQGEIPAEVQEKINRRIGKEVAKTKAERDQREALETKLADAEARLAERPSRAATSTSPLGNIHDPAKLELEKGKAEQALEQAEDLLAQIEDDPAGVEQVLRSAKVDLKGEDGEDDYSAARMKKFLRNVKVNADRMVRRTIPERAQFLQKANEAANQAVELVPELKDPKSEHAKLFRQALSDLPEIQNHPQWPLMAVLGVLGRQKLNEMIAAKKAPAAVKKPEKPVVIPTPRAQPAVTTTKAKPTETVDAKALADGLLNGDKRTRFDYIKSLVPKT
jgi:hypothetical protein